MAADARLWRLQPRTLGQGVPGSAQLMDEQPRRAFEDRGHVAVRDAVAQQVLGFGQPLMLSPETVNCTLERSGARGLTALISFRGPGGDVAPLPLATNRESTPASSRVGWWSTFTAADAVVTVSFRTDEGRGGCGLSAATISSTLRLHLCLAAASTRS